MIVKKAPFPAAMTMISFVLFVIVYTLLTAGSLEPYYLTGLIFSIPFLCFGAITYITATNRLNILASSIITGALTLLLGIAMFFVLILFGIDTATTVTTDPGKYEKALKITGYPNSPLTRYFPDELPEHADHISFYYNPAFLQGQENLSLKFESDPASLQDYLNLFSPDTIWSGKPSDRAGEDYGIYPGTFSVAGYEELPDDFTVYLTYSKSYKPNDWNHGALSLIAVSLEKSEIIFLSQDW